MADEINELSDDELDNVSGGIIYKVEPGDTLTAIAKRFGVTVSQIVKWNDKIVNPNYIQAGWGLVIKNQVPTDIVNAVEQKARGGFSR